MARYTLFNMTCACGKSWMTWNPDASTCFDADETQSMLSETQFAEYMAHPYGEIANPHETYAEYVAQFQAADIHVVTPHEIGEGFSLADVVESIRNTRTGYYPECGGPYFAVDTQNQRIVKIRAYAGGNGNGYDQIHPLVSEFSLTTGVYHQVELPNNYLTNFSFGISGTYYTPLRDETETEDVLAALYRCSIRLNGLHWQLLTDDIDLHALGEKITRHALPAWGYTNLAKAGSYEPENPLGRVSKRDEIYADDPSVLEVVNGFLRFKPDHVGKVFPTWSGHWLILIGDGHHGSNGAEHYGYHAYAAFGNVPDDFRDHAVTLVTEDIDTGAFRTAPLIGNRE